MLRVSLLIVHRPTARRWLHRWLHGQVIDESLSDDSKKLNYGDNDIITK